MRATRRRFRSHQPFSTGKIELGIWILVLGTSLKFGARSLDLATWRFSGVWCLKFGASLEFVIWRFTVTLLFSGSDAANAAAFHASARAAQNLPARSRSRAMA